MRLALVEAQKAFQIGEIPVGAVVEQHGKLLAQAHNLRQTLCDPSAHAELLALRAAAKAIGDWRLPNCTLYVTLEPCPMCAGAIVMARVKAVWFGAHDITMGCCGSVYRLTEDPAFGAGTPAQGGVLGEICATLLKDFMQKRREDATCCLPY